MIKVLIADDELVVRIGLKTTIDWEANGYQIVGEAVNGKDALELFRQLHPDILITDIKMPVFDGLEVIQQLKSENHFFKALILSHYDDFDYARKAINLGASDYILKTELTEHKLLKTLSQLSNQLEEERRLSPASVANQSQEDGETACATHAQKVRFVKNLLEGKIQAHEIEDYLAARPVIFKFNNFLAACLNIEKQADSSLDSESTLFYQTLDNLSGNLFARRGWDHILVQTLSHFYFLISFEGDYNQPAAWLKEEFETLKRNIEQFLNVQTSLGISQSINQLSKLPVILNQARTAWLSCYYEAENSVKMAGPFVPAVTVHCPTLDTDFIRKTLTAHDIEPVLDHIDTVFDAIRDADNFDFVREVFNDSISLAKMIAAEKKLTNETSLNDERFSYRNFDRLSKFEEVRKYILDLYTQINLVHTGGKSESYSYAISRCIKFITHNYQNPISLSDAADYVGISKCYLSLLFRQETGVNFSNWLANYRIEKATHLLSETNMKIYEVAEMVGFDNPYYFSKVFKDLTGESCKDFKNKATQTAALRKVSR